MRWKGFHIFALPINTTTMVVLLIIAFVLLFVLLFRQIFKLDEPKRTASKRARYSEDSYGSTTAERSGKTGERIVRSYLDSLPKEYDVFNDVIFAFGSNTTQIDHIVVSRYGLFIIETKNMHGKVYGSENSEFWSQYLPQAFYRYFGNEEYKFRNPLWQNNGHIKALRRLIQDDRVPIYSIVVFPTETELKVNTSQAVFSWNRLPSYILKYSTPSIDEQSVARYCALIGSANAANSDKKVLHIQNVKKSKEKRDYLVAAGKCPLCGGTLVPRESRYGKFMGCSNYPRCKYVLK